MAEERTLEETALELAASPPRARVPGRRLDWRRVYSETAAIISPSRRELEIQEPEDVEGLELPEVGR